MLHFASSLTPAATEIVQSGLEIAADLAQDDTLGDEWAVTYPLSAKCFPRQQARAVLLDLLEKLRLPQVYALTTYHWLLIYECLEVQIACLNDDLWPDFGACLQASQESRDAAYLCFPLDSQAESGFSIDFEAFIDLYFWDTDFLLAPSTFSQLGSTRREQLGYRADLFGVLMGLIPHPAELELKRIDEAEASQPESEESRGEL